MMMVTVVIKMINDEDDGRMMVMMVVSLQEINKIQAILSIRLMFWINYIIVKE